MPYINKIIIYRFSVYILYLLYNSRLINTYMTSHTMLSKTLQLKLLAALASQTPGRNAHFRVSAQRKMQY